MSNAIRVLIGYDGSDVAGDAVGVAARLLRGSHAIVATARDSGQVLERAALARLALPDALIVRAAREYERTAHAAAEATAERGRALAEAAGLDAEPMVAVGGSPWRALATAAEERGADVVVCGSRGRGGVGRALLGSTASSLLHHSPVPVLLVPGAAPDLSGPLVIGYDGSEPAREAIRVAARLFPGRRAFVAHAWTSPIGHSLAGRAVQATPLAELQEIAGELEHVFASNARELAEQGAALAVEQGLESDALALESGAGAWRALDRAADAQKAAVVVAGSRGRGALRSTVLGSVSSGLAHNAERPVLIVRQGRGDPAAEPAS